MAAALGVPVGVLFVGWVGQLPHWGELAPSAFLVALLGLWTLGSFIQGGRRAARVRVQGGRQPARVARRAGQRRLAGVAVTSTA
jgi:hypothetical protein